MTVLAHSQRACQVYFHINPQSVIQSLVRERLLIIIYQVTGKKKWADIAKVGHL